MLAAVVLAPVLAKWMLVGLFTERTIPLWGLAHLRFWTRRAATPGLRARVPTLSGTRYRRPGQHAVDD